MIRSKIDHGSSLYASAFPRLLNSLEPVQNACLRLALKTFPTTPLSSLQSSTGSPLLSHRRNLFTINHAIHSPSKLPNMPHTKHNGSFLRNVGLLTFLLATYSCIFLRFHLLGKKTTYTHLMDLCGNRAPDSIPRHIAS